MGNLIKLLVVPCLAIVVFRVTTGHAYNGGESQIIGPHNRFQPKSAGEFLRRVWQQWSPVKEQKWDMLKWHSQLTVTDILRICGFMKHQNVMPSTRWLLMLSERQHRLMS